MVGGPGAGKSHALGTIVSNLDEVDARDDGLAHRAYDYAIGRQRLRVVNDATISSGGSKHALADDIEACLANGKHLVACVNRGVLIEESNSIGQAGNAGHRLVLHLAGTLEAGEELKLDGAAGSFLRAGAIKVGDRVVAHIVIVYADMCSLFEARPSATLVDDSLSGPTASVKDYRIRRLAERRSLAEDKMPAGQLLRRIIEQLADELPDDIRTNPLAANVLSLCEQSPRQSLLTVLRASEVVTGARMTFREAWGTFARAIVGDLTREVRAEDAQKTLAEMADAADAPIDRWRSMRNLAGLRVSQAIYGCGGAASGVLDPVTFFTSSVDPVLDARPGEFQEAQLESGWATPVLDAFSGLVTAASPLDTLLKGLPENDPMRLFVTDFDWELDGAFTQVTSDNGLSDRPRAEAIGWYGDYLTRMYALANGIPAFRQEVAVWTLAWALAPSVPGVLEDDLRTLLRPRRIPGDPSSSVLLPLFASRTTPIVGSARSPRLALKGADVELDTVRRGDRLTLRMHEQAALVGSIELDFAIVREAMSCSHGHVGITNLTNVAGPRLERFRAARLVPSRVKKSQLRLVQGDREEVVSLETSDE